MFKENLREGTVGIEELTSDEFCRRFDELRAEHLQAWARGDTKRVDEKKRQITQLLFSCEKDAYFEVLRLRDEHVKEIEEEAERLKVQSQQLSQEPQSDPQVVESAEFIRNMTAEILEQKETLSQRNAGLEKTSAVKNKHTLNTSSVKEPCRNVLIYLRQITGLVQEKIQRLPEDVRKKLESLMSSFQRLLARMWRLLVIVLLLYELEKLIASLKFEGENMCRRKSRLKYGFEMAAMLALWLSHDVESNPGPPYNNRMSLEWLLRQLSETLKQHLYVKGSLWSTQVAEAAYTAGFPRRFFWNNPSGKNSSGKKDTTETLIKKVKELGLLLERMSCLPQNLSPLLDDLSSEAGRDRLRIHCKIENLESAVEVLLSEQLTSFHKERIRQVFRKINRGSKESDQLLVRSSIRRQSIGRDFGHLADKTSTDDAAACNIDILAGNTLSLLEGRRNMSHGLIMEEASTDENDSIDSDIFLKDSSGEKTQDGYSNSSDGCGHVDHQFVRLVLSHAADHINATSTVLSDGRPSSSDDDDDIPPNVDLIDEFLQGAADIFDRDPQPSSGELSLQNGAVGRDELTTISSENTVIDIGVRNALGTDSSEKISDETTDTNANTVKKNIETNAKTTDDKDGNKIDTPDNSDTLANATTDIGENSTAEADIEKQMELHQDAVRKNDTQAFLPQLVINETLTVLENAEMQRNNQEATQFRTSGSSSTNSSNTLLIQTTQGPTINQTQENGGKNEKDQNLNRKHGHEVNHSQLECGANTPDDEEDLKQPDPLSSIEEKSQTAFTTDDGHMKHLKQRLYEEVKNHFDQDIEKFIKKCLSDLNITTTSSKVQRKTNLQVERAGSDDTDHIHAADEVKRGQGPRCYDGSAEEPEDLDDNCPETSHPDHLEDATSSSSGDPAEEARETPGASSGSTGVSTCRKRKNKKKSGSQSSKKRRH